MHKTDHRDRFKLICSSGDRAGRSRSSG